jgi:hypothetical protein
VIEGYLRELDARLDVPRRLRGRLLDETRDHLLELADGGLSEHEAEQAFGAPEALAREFHEQLASTSAHRSSALTGLMLVVLAVAYAFAPGAWGNGPVVLIAGQIAVVAGVLALVRSLRFRSAHAVPPSRLACIYRANALALGCVALIAIYVAVTGPVMPAAVLGAIALASALALARSVARARPVAGGEPEDDAFDDLLRWPSTRRPSAPRSSGTPTASSCCAATRGASARRSPPRAASRPAWVTRSPTAA